MIPRGVDGGGVTDGGPALAAEGLPGSRGQPDSGLGAVLGVADDGGVAPGGSADRALVAGVLLDVADDGTLGDLVEREHVARRQLGLVAAVDVLPRVGALRGQEVVLLLLVLVRVSEVHPQQRRSSARVVQDVSHHALHVPMRRMHSALPFLLRVVQVPVQRGSHSLRLVRFVNTRGSPTSRSYQRIRTSPSYL